MATKVKRERLTTKHPGSKVRAARIPFGTGNRVYLKSNPGNTGTVIRIDKKTGAFKVRWDEKATTGERSFTYHAYLAHNFAVGNPPKIEGSS